MTEVRAWFESWRGRYADSPRAVSEALALRRPDVGRTWVGDGGGPQHANRTVRRHSLAYFTRLAVADLVVANDIISRQVVKGPRAHYLQTWHGTPLKVIGLDEPAPVYAGADAHRRRMLRDVRAWDWLVSPSPECTTRFRSAFGFEGTVLETGYPRNDVLRQDPDRVVRRRVRQGLGLADDAFVVLYAPTWRDDVRGEDGRPAFVPDLDPAELADLLPDGSVVLSRMHQNVATGGLRDSPLVRQVSDHPEVAELYLAADALVTDYSSAVYDFVVTGKPVVLFAPDLDHYCSTRPMYYDYEAWAPGPIARTTGDLGEALSRAARDGVVDTDRYRSFVERFCPFEDGHATDRVLDAVLPELTR